METRIKKSIFNVSSSIIILMIKTILTFITRTVFIKFLGQEALGINGLLTNILSMLSLAELGISTAINFSLYKPLAIGDKKNVSIIMSLYRKIYVIIGILIFVLGIILIPALSFFVNDIENIENFYLIYLLYLINTCSTYFLAYKDVLITADQKAYKLTNIRTIFLVILNISLVGILYITKNFIAYLIVQFLVLILERIVVNRYITKNYADIDFKSKEKLNIEDKQEIKKNIKAMFFHKIGDYCINGTDNIIISKFINITVVGCYSNYLMIVSMINNFISTMYNSIISSLGNLIVVEENGERRKNVFENINFISFVLYGFSSICLINCLNPFILWWIGEEYIFDFNIVLVLVINFYITGMRVPVGTIKSAAGLYDIDKYTPLLQAVLNLVFSIILVNYFGVLGVLLGTLISSIAVPCWQRPYLVYKYVFNKSSKDYFKNYFRYLIILTFISFVTICINDSLIINNDLIKVFVNFFISAIIFMCTVYVLFRKSKEYKYVKNVIISFIKKR